MCHSKRVGFEATPAFTDSMRLASVEFTTDSKQTFVRSKQGFSVSTEVYGTAFFSQRFFIYAAAKSRRRSVHRRAAGPLEHFSPRALHRRERCRPENKADAFYGAAADFGRHAAAGRRAVPIRGSVAGGRFFDGAPGGTGGGSDRRRDYYHSHADCARMVGNARGGGGWAARRVDAASDSQQRRTVEFWSFHIFKYSQSGGEIYTESGHPVGDAAAGGVRGLGAWPRGAGAGYQTEMAFCHRSA